MARFRLPRRVVAVLALAAALAVPATMDAQARPRGEDAQAHATVPASNLGERLWRLLVKLWEKEGCIIDPNGHCTKRMTAKSDAGCIIDPNGVCRGGTGTTVQADEGCILDPNGGCSH